MSISSLSQGSVELKARFDQESIKSADREYLLNCKITFIVYPINVIVCFLLIAVLVLYYVLSLDTNENYFCSSSENYVSTNCIELNDGQYYFSNANHTAQCRYQFCLLNTCDRKVNSQTGAIIQDNDDDYYQYETEESEGLRMAIFASFIVYSICTEFLNKIAEGLESKRTVDILPFLAMLLWPGLVAVVAGISAELYFDGNDVWKYVLLIFVVLAISFKISYTSLENLYTLDTYLTSFRSYRVSVSNLRRSSLKIGLENKPRADVLDNLLIAFETLEIISHRLYWKLIFEVVYTIYFTGLVLLDLNLFARGQPYRYTTILTGLCSIQLLFLSILQITFFNDEMSMLESENRIVTTLKVNVFGLQPTTVLVASISFNLATAVLGRCYYNLNFCQYAF